MGFPRVDFSPKNTVSVTAQNVPPNGTTSTDYLFPAAPSQNFFVIDEVSVNCDSNFCANGQLSGSINGLAFTSQAGVLQSVQPASSFTIRPAGENKRSWVIFPQSQLIIQFWISAGHTGVTEVLGTFTEMTPQEYRIWQSAQPGGLQ